MEKTPIVMFVDDEPNILKTLRRLFMDEDYEVHTAGNGRDALALIEGGIQPTVIVSDQRMPEMGGAEFLAKASQLAPDSIRMVLTGYADINAAVEAINLGGIYRYILKPWNDDDLKLTVREAVSHFRLVEAHRLLTQELADKNDALSQMNARLEEMVHCRTLELQQKVKELEGRDEIQQYLLQIHPLEALLAKVLEVVARVCRASGLTYFELTGGEPGDWRCKVCLGPDCDRLDQEAQAALLPAMRQMVAEIQAGAEDQDLMPPDHVVRHGGFDHCLAPVVKGRTVFGVLVASRAETEPFSEAERRALVAFALQAAIGVNDCNLHEHYDDIQSSLDDVLADLGGL